MTNDELERVITELEAGLFSCLLNNGWGYVDLPKALPNAAQISTILSALKAIRDERRGDRLSAMMVRATEGEQVTVSG